MTHPFPLPTIKDVRDAAGRIRPHAFRTPLLESAFLNDLLGTRVLLKAEVLGCNCPETCARCSHSPMRISQPMCPCGYRPCWRVACSRFPIALSSLPSVSVQPHTGEACYRV
jgi:hypothetical protein